MRRALIAGISLVIGCARAPLTVVESAQPAVVVARAALPADTFSPGPPSGHHLDGVHGAPWPSQPVQGFSALIADVDGGFLAVTDNGYGVAENSSDFLLRVYELSADFDAGTLSAKERFTLSDPDRRVGWPIVNHFTERRELTGADLDPESMVRAPDGTFWFGDELGPFLVHTDATGRVLEAPFELTTPDGGALRSPDFPFFAENLALHSLEALRADALAHDAGAPWFSPDEKLLGAEQLTKLHRAGFRVIPWTVNDPRRIEALIGLGVDGLITDRPDLVHADAGFDLEGHRGARGLRPENTLPAFEAALDQGVTTLELDLTATDDGAIVSHDGKLDARKCRSLDAGVALELTRVRSEVAEKRWICDRLQPEFPEQTNDRDLSPATRSFAPMRLQADLYSPIEPERLLSFLSWYQGYYSGGVGRSESAAKERVATARAVRLNIETKIHGTGTPHDDPVWLTRSLGDLLTRTGFVSRASLQSFDWRSLRVAHAELPALQTVMLLGTKNATATDEMRAELPWREVNGLPQVGRSGGIENLALSPDGTTLYAMLEKPLPGPPFSRAASPSSGVEGARELLAFSFDLAAKRFTGVAWRYPLDAAAVGDMTIGPDGTVWALERDDGEGATARFKKLIRFRVPSSAGGLVEKRVAADLLALRVGGADFTFPFITPEGVAVLPGGRVAIIADNNFPFGHARQADAPDDTELIIVEPVR